MNKMNVNKITDAVSKLRLDAIKNQIDLKSRTIAQELGKKQPKKYGSWWVYDQDGIAISYDDFGDNISIVYQAVTVFSTQVGNIIRYRPDIIGWINILDKLYDGQVKIIIDKNEIEKREKLEQEMYLKWGIKVE
jgi:hypothetical protein